MSGRGKFKVDRDVAEYEGPYHPYDLVKEGVLALVVIGILTIGLATLFGSPDERALTIKNWATAPSGTQDFIYTAATELTGTSGVAGYGPPYNNALGGVQKLGPWALPDILGVRIPIDTAKDFVIKPLLSQPGPPALRQALATYTHASPAQQLTWANAYVARAASVNADGSVSYHVRFLNDRVVMPPGNYGPVETLMQYETQIARSGALDQALITPQGFYSTDYTKPSLFLADGGWFAGIGEAQHLGGDQWGMMNETNSYPGQAWLWLYTLLYQVPPYSTHWAADADVDVWFTMVVLTLVLALVPFIPGIRSIPRWTRVYRLIWRTHYRELERP
jgi:hypothetical protein